jgi:16S rRNA (uracil1498-N3)-methyltransferase
MPAFFVVKDNIRNNCAVIEGDEAKHIAQVLRMKINHPITLFDRDGTIYSGIIISTGHKQIQVRVVDKNIPADYGSGKIIIGQALPKAKKMDLIIQKSTELGVTGIMPFYCSRSIPRYDQRKAEERVRHWQNISIAAVKQSGIRKVPTIHRMVSFQEIVTTDFHGFLKLICWEEEHKLTLGTALRETKPLQDIIFLIGPEGGFTKDEADFAQTNGFVSVSLGKPLLRTETVSITVLTIIRYEMGAFG